MDIKSLEKTDLDDKSRAEIRAAEQVATRIGAGEHLNDWLLLGPGLMTGRKFCMRISNSGVPKGRRYSEAFAAWLAAHPALAAVYSKKEPISRLLWLFEEPERLAALDELRRTWTPLQHAQITTPITAAQKVKDYLRDQDPNAAPKPGKDKQPARERVKELEAMLARDGGDVSSKDTVDNIVRVFAETMSASKLYTLAKAIQAAAETKAAQENAAPVKARKKRGNGSVF